MSALATTRPGETVSQDGALQVGAQLALGVRGDALLLPIVATEGEEGLEMVLHREETHSRAGGVRSEVPTDMWVKRPHGQLLKCAKAASLRAPFPEEADYSAEEMEGKVIEADGMPGEAAGEVIEPVHSADEKVASDVNVGRAVDKGAAIKDEVKEQVERLIARAAKVGAWGQAEEYCRSRFKGTHLAYALEELRIAKDEAQSKKPERKAA
jgi:hypothetical protein